MAPTSSNEVATQVAAAIGRSNKSRNAIALESGIPLTTLNRKVNGHSDFTAGELIRVAATLNVSVGSFFSAAERSVA
jgi:hypothetical protein